MNEIVPGWSFILPYQPTVVGKYLSISARVSIPTKDQGVVVREMTGAVEMKDGDLKDGYGDPVTTAAHKAVRKALAYYGFGLEFELPEIYMELKPNGKIPKYDERQAVDKWKYYNQGGRGQDNNKHASNAPGRRNDNRGARTQAQSRKPQDSPTGTSLADLKKAYYDCGINLDDHRDKLGPVVHGLYAGPDSLAGVRSTNQLDEGSGKVIKVLGAILNYFPPGEYANPEAVQRSARAFIQRTVEEGLILDKPSSLKSAIAQFKTPA
jgi:hypothetical protein